MKVRMVVAVVGMVLVSLTAVATAKDPVAAVNATDGLGLKGYDPVAYFTASAAIPGVEEHSFRWKGVTYRFVSAENLDLFKAEPDKYLPQYGGYSAYSMSLGKIADADPNAWRIVDGKLYLNKNIVSGTLWRFALYGNIAEADKTWAAYPKAPEPE